jgi:DNA repair exonuclease SbcCD ATPase subunit
MNLLSIRKKVNDLLSQAKMVRQQTKEEKNTLQITENYLNAVKEAQNITQHIAQQIQQQAHNQIAGVVDKCLKTVFGDEYGFAIHFDRKRGRTEAELVLLKDGYEINDPLNADSGGVVDVAAFALRLSCLILAKPKLRRVLILDEPFKFVSAEYLDNVRTLLESLSKDFEIQFIMVTHIEALKTGKVIQL